MTILAIDYGAKKIGLAKSDTEQSMALPLDIIPHTSKQEVLEKINNICQENSIEKIVVGVPVSLSNGKKDFIREIGLENKQMKEVLGFIDWLKQNIHLPIEMEDERLSTKLASNMMKGEMKGEDDDAVAAMLILQSYLDRSKAQSSNAKIS